MSDVIVCPMPPGVYLHRGPVMGKAEWQRIVTKYEGVELNGHVVTRNASLFHLRPGQRYNGGRVDKTLPHPVPFDALFWLEKTDEPSWLSGLRGFITACWRTLQVGWTRAKDGGA